MARHRGEPNAGPNVPGTRDRTAKLAHVAKAAERPARYERLRREGYGADVSG